MAGRTSWISNVFAKIMLQVKKGQFRFDADGFSENPPWPYFNFSLFLPAINIRTKLFLFTVTKLVY